MGIQYDLLPVIGGTDSNAEGILRRKKRFKYAAAELTPFAAVYHRTKAITRRTAAIAGSME